MLYKDKLTNRLIDYSLKTYGIYSAPQRKRIRRNISKTGL